MLRNSARIVGIFIFILAGISFARADSVYLADVATAASDIAQGSYDSAVDDATRALSCRSDDPLAHIALGTVLLHVRQIDQAATEFATASKLASSDPLALYGLSLCHLAKGNRAAARDCLTEIQDESLVDTAPAMAYLSSLWGFPVVKSVSSESPVISEIKAEEELKQGSAAEALKLLGPIAKSRKGFIENPGAVVTFDPENPLAFTAPPLARAYNLPQTTVLKDTRLSGTLTLKAGITDRKIAYVLFYIDSKAVMIVNHRPFECQYDTHRLTNGEHLIRIEGRDDNAEIITDKSAKIDVYNKDAVKPDPVTGEQVKQIRAALWESLQLRPSIRAACYGMIKASEKDKDPAGALAAAEWLVGVDPDYKDARAELLRRYGQAPPYREVWHVKTTEKVAAITFDDGPKDTTEELLAILAEKNVKATFFVVGMMADKYSDILKKMSEAGHEIESHTYTHRNLEYISDSEVERELIRNQAIIRSILGRTPRFLRAPGGHYGGIVASTAARYGLSQVMWTVNCGSSEGKPPEVMVRQVLNQTTPGSIILMHNTEVMTLRALPEIIDGLRAKGYKLVTLSEMLQYQK